MCFIKDRNVKILVKRRVQSSSYAAVLEIWQTLEVCKIILTKGQKMFLKPSYLTKTDFEKGIFT